MQQIANLIASWLTVYRRLILFYMFCIATSFAQNFYILLKSYYFVYL